MGEKEVLMGILRNNETSALCVAVILFGLTCVSGAALLSSEVVANDTAVDDVSISVAGLSCNLTTNSSTGAVYDISAVNGQYKNDIGKTRLNVFCNTKHSFEIYAVGFSGDTEGNNEMVSSTAGVSNIATGTATSGDNSQWAMKVEAVAGTGVNGDNVSYTPAIVSPFDDFAAVPASAAKVAEVTSVSGKTNEGAIDASYAVYVSAKQPSGSYQGKVKYTVLHSSAGAQSGFEDAYADAGKSKVNGYYTMQDMSASICDAVNIIGEGSQTQLIDARDNKTYYVAKLADGECWMTQNLDHDIRTTFAYTPDNTDIPRNWTPDKSTYATSTTTWDTSTNGYNIQQSYDPGDKIWDGTPSSSTSITINNMTQGTNQHYHLGNYYNWGAAVAMNNTSAYTTQYQDVNQSICPKGWMLPKSGNITTAGSFQYLVNQYNWASNSMTNPNMWASPLYFPLAGYWNGSSNAVAYRGYFWSSVVYSSSYAYNMDGNYSGTVYPAANRNRYNGFSVRCVAREAGSTPGITLANITTMQEMTSDICAATTVGATATLKDTRDNSTYSVAKLADNKCWMTQNMRLDFSKLVENISANNTNNPSSTFITAANTKPAANNGTWCTSNSSDCYNQLQ